MFRIQPTEIHVPEDDPFTNDLLSRKQPIEVLTNLVGSLEGPCVLALDAPWGTGKTTFLRIWQQHLRNHGFCVADFNAWDTDFAGDPLLALSTAILNSLESEGTPVEAALTKLKDQMPAILKAVAPSAISVATGGVLNIQSLLASSERVDHYHEAVKLFGSFREDLQNAANAVFESRASKPLIVLIDELDRCRPPYAIELLEIAKHLFAARHVVFVLAVNRPELEQSVKALYGDGFDAHGYLRRFFDIDYRLPAPEREAFIAATLDSTGIAAYLNQSRDPDTHSYARLAKEMLNEFFSLPGLSIRTIAQAIHRLGLVFASLSADHQPLFLPATTALILRTLDLDLYRHFVGGQVAVDELVQRLASGSDGEAFLRTRKRYVFEAMLIIAAGERGKSLLEEYAAVAGNDMPEDAVDQAKWKHADATVQLVGAKSGWYGWEGEFNTAVARLELFSKSLI